MVPVSGTEKPVPIDVSVAHPARIYDDWLAGNPGIVPLNRWRPGPDEPVFDRDIRAVAGLARKP